jgi:hypothetical protein
MLNFLALLGWSPGNDIEVMTLPQMVELFDVAGLQKKAAIFDPKKLEWMRWPAPEPRLLGGALRARGAAMERRGWPPRTSSRRGATGSSRSSISSRCARARSTTSSGRRDRTLRGHWLRPDVVAKQWRIGRGRSASSPGPAMPHGGLERLGARADGGGVAGACRASRVRREGGEVFQLCVSLSRGSPRAPGISTFCWCSTRPLACPDRRCGVVLQDAGS